MYPMSLKASIFAGLVLASSANLALAACEKPTVPALPDPATAVTPEMVKAKNDVKAYVSSAKAYLECGISTKQHNKTVDKMQKLAKDFNSIVRAYKARLAG